MTHFVFDCDDVLLNWQSGFIAFLNNRGINPCPKGPVSWDLAPWIGCSGESAKSWVQRFNSSPDFSRLDAMPAAVDTLWALRDAGHTISLLTACGSNPSVRLARAANLYKLFERDSEVPYIQVQMIDLGESKFLHLYNIYEQVAGRTDAVFVEDNFEHARSGIVNGMTAYCLRRNHNRGHEADNLDSSVIWIDSIDEIARRHVEQRAE